MSPRERRRHASAPEFELVQSGASRSGVLEALIGRHEVLGCNIIGGVDDLVIESIERRRLRLSTASAHRDVCAVTLETDAGAVSADVYDHWPNFAAFLQDLAATLPFEGERRYQSAEHEFSVACTQDDLGTVTCLVVLSRPWPPTWSHAAELQFGAGAHLQGIADEVTDFIASTTL